MTNRTSLVMGAIGALALSGPALAGPMGVKVGVLSCNVESGWGYVLGSSKQMHCSYHPNHGQDDYYDGRISKFGVDLGYSRGANIVWDVVAPTTDVDPGALAGNYVGATASASVGIGAGANALLGGFEKSIALQPISVEGNSGFDVAAGIGEMNLRTAPPPRKLTEWKEGREFTVYFGFNQSTLSPEARDVIHRAVATAEHQGPVRVAVAGHTDTVGSESYNDGLSKARADAVKRAMLNAGLEGAPIRTEGYGFDDPKVPTAPGVRAAENRRAVIDIEPEQSAQAAE